MDNGNSNDRYSSIKNSSKTFNEKVDSAQGIWSPDVEQSFLEALAIYPSCGRRKIVLSDEGKMYGRNELVARYIKIRTGKIRTRKQVSSHIQVLAKRRSKELDNLRNDKNAQKVILDRIKRYTSTDTISTDINDEHNERKHVQEHHFYTKNKQFASDEGNPIIFDQTEFSPSTSHFIRTEVSKRKKSTQQQITSNESSTDMKHNLMTYFPLKSSKIEYYNTSQPCYSSYNRDCVNNESTSLSSALIGNENFRLTELNTFIERKRKIIVSHPSLASSYSDSYSIYHLDIFRLNSQDTQIRNRQAFEAILIDQVFDKFPHSNGLKDLYKHNPNGSFYLIKLWTNPCSSTMSKTNPTTNENESFFTSCTYTSYSNQPIQISTRLCSFGKQVLEKLEISENPQRDQHDQYIFHLDRVPLCDYMVQFIQKLRSLPNAYMMNSVLENFTILQVIRQRNDSQKLLLCLAFVFEISTFDDTASQYKIYKLVSN